MTNALAEIGLILVSVALGVLDVMPSLVAVSASCALAWWLWVHQQRLAALVRAMPLKAASSFGLAIVFITIMHALAFGVGFGAHEILGLT